MRAHTALKSGGIRRAIQCRESDALRGVLSPCNGLGVSRSAITTKPPPLDIGVHRTAVSYGILEVGAPSPLTAGNSGGTDPE